MFSADPDADLRQMADDSTFLHRDAARHAMRFRASGDVADLVAVLDDPHPCGMTDLVFAMAGAKRPWLNWVPMPSEAITNVANDIGGRRARGEQLEVTGLGLSAAEPASAITACRRVAGPMDIGIAEFPPPDIRTPVRPGRYAVWRYDGTEPVPAVPAPSADAVRLLQKVGGEPWQSPLSGYDKATPLGELPLGDLLGLLAHLPGPPDTPRWQHLATSTPTYWYRLMQPWVCLGILHHAGHEPWPTSIRREVLVDLAFGVEDWVADAALFALVTAAYREPELRAEVRQLVRARLDAAVAADRLVTIEESLAKLMLVTPGCRADDRALATAVLARAAQDDEDEEPQPAPAEKRRWWRRRG
ncbi:hypothetical protein ONA70_34280 [Micromonospora yasonensis]|uniref:hypothetical protein n=1 Tax=Micromonospora yasonensis TaxID=1128667 RepID=UPI002230E1E6|nr:hypothetical protein [Micromonospora yasonensis]MCW3845148.1 hypothetical protein [Micromonospora yasonensis]